MKKLIASMLIVTWLASPAGARVKGKRANNMKPCYAATCTDHSYDQAYNAGANNSRTDMNMQSKAPGVCLAATCTDHSYDQAYNPRRDGQTAANNGSYRTQSWSGWTYPAGERYYTLDSFTTHGRHPNRGMNAPYYAQDAASNDGAAANEYRNMRAGNTSEPLPAINGGK